MADCTDITDMRSWVGIVDQTHTVDERSHPSTVDSMDMADKAGQLTD